MAEMDDMGDDVFAWLNKVDELHADTLEETDRTVDPTDGMLEQTANLRSGAPGSG